ncbi:hypothetical protein L1049_003515 [Liquidambar formosana]|uniref:Uncharacterized protein n=1 Tax=Liquidambar formosana TaxID=63359 RepID=A0AAP0R1G9_LIQFO
MKSVADDTTQHPTRREGSYGQETVQVQHQNNFKSGMKLAVDDTTQQATRRQGSSYGQETVQAQHQNNFKSGLKLAADDTTQQATRREGSTYGKETVQVQHQNNFESGMKLMADNTTRRPTRREGSYGQDIVQVQHQNNFESGMNLVADDTTRQPTRREGNYRREIVQVQHQNNFEAVMKAQKCNNGFLERSLKSRRMADSNNQYQVFERPVEHGQDIGPMTSIEKDNGEGFGLFGKPKFSTSSSDQAAASMYLTLPTVLTGPCVENRRIDSSSCSYNQPGISGNKTDGNTERANRMLEASIQGGYFSGMKQQEQLGRIAQVGSINMGSLGRNTAPTLSIGAGFPVPLNHQVLDGGFSIPRQAGMENLPRENSNILGLRMNGGAIRFSAGSNALQERYVANKQGRLFPN